MSKFTQLVKIAKQKLDEIERALQQNAANINNKQIEIDSLVAELSQLIIPQGGKYQEFLNYSHYKDEYRNTIDFKQQELAFLKAKRRELQENFRVQNIEYEKAKYLDNLEIQKAIKAAKMRESRDMDEISTMLFANKEK